MIFLRNKFSCVGKLVHIFFAVIVHLIPCQPHQLLWQRLIIRSCVFRIYIITLYLVYRINRQLILACTCQNALPLVLHDPPDNLRRLILQPCRHLHIHLLRQAPLIICLHLFHPAHSDPVYNIITDKNSTDNSQSNQYI